MKAKHRKVLAASVTLGVAALITLAYANERRVAAQDDAQRAQYASQIVKRWGPQIERRYGMAPGEWTDQMIGTFGASDVANLRRAARAGTFDEMTGALFGGSSAANMTDVRPMQIGDTENDLVMTPLPPCRIVDTRVAGGILTGNTTRSFRGWTTTDFITQGGSSTNCGIPENASALLANVVAVDTARAYGYMTIYPSNTGRPTASTINYVGSNVANHIALKLCRPGCANQFTVYTTADTHVVIDVYGYYMEPVATPLDCVVNTQTGTLLNLNLINVTSSCPTGYTATGGGCGGPLGLTVASSGPAVDANGRPTGWTCGLATSIVGGLLGYEVDATCCRIPGR